MKSKGWSTTTFVAIGALAALYVVLLLPGAFLTGIIGPLGNLTNIIITGIMFTLVPLITKRQGAVTFWALIAGFLLIPLPINGPAGFVLKVVWVGLWGFIADITYLIFRRWERVSALAIGIVQVAPAGPLAAFWWSFAGVNEMANAAAKFAGLSFILIGVVVGAALGYAAYLIQMRIKNTAVVRRIQRG